MEIKGHIIQVLPQASGVSKQGNNWKKQEYVLETIENYPRKVCFNLFGDKVDQYPLQVGEEVIVSFDLESREFNGRWYTDVRAWKVEKPQAPDQAAPYADPNFPATPAFSAPEPTVPQFPGAMPEANPTDDLPF